MNTVSMILCVIACFVATSAQQNIEWYSGDWKPITGPRLEELLRLRDAGTNIERR